MFNWKERFIDLMDDGTNSGEIARLKDAILAENIKEYIDGENLEYNELIDMSDRSLTGEDMDRSMYLLDSSVDLSNKVRALKAWRENEATDWCR